MLKTFRTGGIEIPENKITAGKHIRVLPLPGQVIIPLSQHAGEAATPAVAVGDEVKTGMLIGTATGFISAGVHSSVSGKVAKIEHIVDANGVKNQAVFIDTAEDVWEEGIIHDDKLLKNCNLSAKQILEKIKSAGIVGLGGAAFPTHVKLSPPPGSKAEILIINAVECEPYLTSDHILMMEKGEEIMTGIKIMMTACGVKRAVIGIENNKKDAIEHLSRIAEKAFGVEVVALKTCYPQGSEKQLVDAILNRQIPSGQLPVSVGAIVQNVGSAYAVYEAVQKNKPLIERVVTVTGKNLKNPCNLLVRIGTPVHHLIEYAGGLPDDTGKIVSGGPMMGRALPSVNLPVVKGTSGILVIPGSESQRKEMSNCIRCAQCTGVCCMGLNPSLLMNGVDFKDWELVEKNAVMNCLECGSCSYTCPAHRPLLDYIRKGKTRIRALMKLRAKAAEAKN
jgi:electron transport complex protein RnfC